MYLDVMANQKDYTGFQNYLYHQNVNKQIKSQYKVIQISHTVSTFMWKLKIALLDIGIQIAFTGCALIIVYC